MQFKSIIAVFFTLIKMKHFCTVVIVLDYLRNSVILPLLMKSRPFQYIYFFIFHLQTSWEELWCRAFLPNGCEVTTKCRCWRLHLPVLIFSVVAYCFLLEVILFTFNYNNNFKLFFLIQIFYNLRIQLSLCMLNVSYLNCNIISAKIL